MHNEHEKEAKRSNLLLSIEQGKEQTFTPTVAWKVPTMPSFANPVAYRGVAYWVNNAGVVSAYDVKSGEQLFAERIKQTCWAAPLGFGDRVYFFGKDGLTTVLQAGPAVQGPGHERFMGSVQPRLPRRRQSWHSRRQTGRQAGQFQRQGAARQGRQEARGQKRAAGARPRWQDVCRSDPVWRRGSERQHGDPIRDCRLLRSPEELTARPARGWLGLPPRLLLPPDFHAENPVVSSRTCLALVLALLVSAPVFGQHVLNYEGDPIRYSNGTPDNPVARLQARIGEGRVKLAFDPKFGYLPAVLKELSIPVSSQMLTFGKTSLQSDHIGPATPRAIYFNDAVHVGFVKGANTVLEIAVADRTARHGFLHARPVGGHRAEIRTANESLPELSWRRAKPGGARVAGPIRLPRPTRSPRSRGWKLPNRSRQPFEPAPGAVGT